MIFEILPASIKQLSLLEQLILCFCRKIRSLPELPHGIKNLYANGCFSLESISNVCNHPFEELMLAGCLQLYQDLRLYIQRMVHSVPIHKKEIKQWACFSATEVPGYFGCQSTQQILTIPCAWADSGSQPVGFVAGVVAAGHYFCNLSSLNIYCRWHGEGYPSRQIHFDLENLPWLPFCLFPGLLLVFSCNFGEEIPCDKLSFLFEVHIRTTDSVCNGKIKGCGVQLWFTDDQFRQAWRQNIEEGVEYDNFSDLGTIHQPGHNENLNNEEVTQAPNSKRPRFR